jgi:hypothetical protein
MSNGKMHDWLPEEKQVSQLSGAVVPSATFSLEHGASG